MDHANFHADHGPEVVPSTNYQTLPQTVVGEQTPPEAVGGQQPQQYYPVSPLLTTTAPAYRGDHKAFSSVSATETPPPGPLNGGRHEVLFWRRLTIILAVLLVVGAIVGTVAGGVVGTQNKKDLSTCQDTLAALDSNLYATYASSSTTTASSSATGTTASSTATATTTSSVYTAPTDVTVNLTCSSPDNVDGIPQQVTIGNTSNPVYTFTPACNVARQNGDLFSIVAYSLNDCISACANVIFHGTNCEGVTFSNDMTDLRLIFGANCFLKSNWSDTTAVRDDTYVSAEYNG